MIPSATANLANCWRRGARYRGRDEVLSRDRKFVILLRMLDTRTVHTRTASSRKVFHGGERLARIMLPLSIYIVPRFAC